LTNLVNLIILIHIAIEYPRQLSEIMEKPEREDFGSFLRGLRQHKRYSLKSLANEMNVDYTYLSKLENGHSTPSERLIEKVAAFFDYDKEELMVRAGKIPEDVLRIISDNPKEAIQFLRKEFGD